MRWSKVFLIFSSVFLIQFSTLAAFLKTARVEEIPFSLSLKNVESVKRIEGGGIHAITSLEKQRGFLHLFHVPYILCFFAAKGKWPLIPPFVQPQVDSAAKTLFKNDDGFIKQFCQKWVQIKECFRPIFATPTPTIEALSKVRDCPCASDSPTVFFDRDHIGKVSSDVIHDTIEFLESFLPEPTKKPKRRKNRVRGRIDEMEVE